MDLFPDNDRLHKWMRGARDKISFQGLPARICWLGYGERDKAGLAFNDLVARGEVSAPIVIGRDHLDCGSVASPYRETEAMLDGSDAIADWPLLNAHDQHGVAARPGCPSTTAAGSASAAPSTPGRSRVADGTRAGRAEAGAGADQRSRHGSDPARRRRLRAGRAGRRRARRADPHERRKLIVIIDRARHLRADVVGDRGHRPRSDHRWLSSLRLTAADLSMREWFSGECATRGLDLTEDRMGNQWAWWGDPDSSSPGGVATGSHLDSVPDGGAFDGPLGVVSALAAIDRLRADGFVPHRPIGVVNFVDEEGARFGVSCAGSRVITGVLSPDRARALRDADGISMAEAMRLAGRQPDQLGPDPEALARVGCVHRAAHRAGPRPDRPRPSRSPSEAGSGRTVGGGSIFRVRPTTPAPPG